VLPRSFQGQTLKRRSKTLRTILVFIGLAQGTSSNHSLDNICEDYFSVSQKFSDCDDCADAEDEFEVVF